ncbi:L-gulonolactone oxidase [Rubrobacter xylanophilus]|uniref:L-gulonolactone oxidase n=1 Tax=Rubrobacter xylanophilus TaxID=49319 RepID=A0A510HL75_9ACTN|nr:D-arabinono-1,4-lactone oxidase [Rubrobacter xylanophilus]BBL80781.1 L-gulonolactone oxidase [Rubrobacter xylanophilus]
MRWRNWSGTVTAAPRRIVDCRTVEDVVVAVREVADRGGTLRPVGAGHSFTPLCATDDTLLRVDGLTGVVATADGRVRVRAGTRLRDLGRALAERGLAPINLGDIDRQTLAGATATGTHGTGARLGTLSSQLTALRLVLPSGEVVRCDPQVEPDLFDAARVGLGALGVVVEAELAVLPGYRLHTLVRHADLDEVLADLDGLLHRHRHVEFYWFPYGTHVQLKIADPTDAPEAHSGWEQFNEVVLENGALWAISELCRLVPPLTRPVARNLGRLVARRERVAAAHRAFATPRWVRFVEMEYAVPRPAFTAVLEGIREVIVRSRPAVHFPIECRFVAADDAWLSPAYGRDSAYIAVHQYRGMSYEAYFRAVEEVLVSHGGRPHWGKLHRRRAEDLASSYPAWERWLDVRGRVDPRGALLNPHLRRLFGL